MAKIHTLTYNGTKSSDLGVFVSGSGSFDAAEFDVDKYEIPGRNGDLILSNNRYKNIEITYPAFIPKAFMDKVQNVRNWLRSSKTYARLEDTYDMDHYRLGIPTGVQSFSPENRNDGANFEMTFDCKPQRFLKVGETPETVEADVQTETGEIVTFETVAESPITSASVSLSPIQSLNGYDSPWPAGGGKNKIPSQTVNKAGNNYFVAGTSSEYPIALKAGTYTFSNEGVSAYAYWQKQGTTDNNAIHNGATNAGTFTITEDANYKIWFYQVNVTASDFYNIQLEIGSSATSYEPYANICPISGHAGAELWDDPVYGGTIEWNQLIEKGNMTDGWTFSNSSGSYANNILTFTATAQNGFVRPTAPQSIVSGHKYFGTVDIKGATAFLANVLFDGRGEGHLIDVPVSTSWGRYSKIFTNTVTEQNYYPRIADRRASGWDAVQIRNCMLIDLTQMFGAGNEPATVEEFRTLFPLDYYAYNAGESTCVSAVNGGDYRHYSVTFTDQGTVYGGTYDFVTGKLTVTWTAQDMGTMNWTASSTPHCFYSSYFPQNYAVGDSTRMLCSAYRFDGLKNSAPYYGDNGTFRGYLRMETSNPKEVYFHDENYSDAASFKTAVSGQYIAYELETPHEYTLSPQQLTTLQGQNVVWGNGTVTLTYAEPYNIDNQTLFDARPLFTVTNPEEGDVIMVNGQAITFVDGYTGTVYIDCETMNAFSGAANLNSIIQATDFPVLVPGTNIVTWTGAGECTMTPRWWEL